MDINSKKRNGTVSDLSDVSDVSDVSEEMKGREKINGHQFVFVN